MTRDDILKEYEVDEQGVIKSPGKFEGEMLYVPYFFEAVVNGEYQETSADFDIGAGASWDMVVISKEDRDMFPELTDLDDFIHLSYADNGFVYGETMTMEEHEDFLEELFEKDAQVLGKNSNSKEEFALWLEAFHKKSIATEVIKVRDAILSEHEEVVNKIVSIGQKVYELNELSSEFPQDVKPIAKELLLKNQILDTAVNSKLNGIEDVLRTLSKNYYAEECIE